VGADGVECSWHLIHDHLKKLGACPGHKQLQKTLRWLIIHVFATDGDAEEALIALLVLGTDQRLQFNESKGYVDEWAGCFDYFVFLARVFKHRSKTIHHYLSQKNDGAGVFTKAQSTSGRGESGNGSVKGGGKRKRKQKSQTLFAFQDLHAYLLRAVGNINEDNDFYARRPVAGRLTTDDDFTHAIVDVLGERYAWPRAARHCSSARAMLEGTHADGRYETLLGWEFGPPVPGAESTEYSVPLKWVGQGEQEQDGELDEDEDDVDDEDGDDEDEEEDTGNGLGATGAGPVAGAAAGGAAGAAAAGDGPEAGVPLAAPAPVAAAVDGATAARAAAGPAPQTQPDRVIAKLKEWAKECSNLTTVSNDKNTFLKKLDVAAGGHGRGRRLHADQGALRQPVPRRLRRPLDAVRPRGDADGERGGRGYRGPVHVEAGHENRVAVRA
jgi:hypothetical protein